jgi:hypothetical protein
MSPRRTLGVQAGLPGPRERSAFDDDDPAALRGWRLRWRFDSLVTGQKLGMDPPRPIDPGPLAAPRA